MVVRAMTSSFYTYIHTYVHMYIFYIPVSIQARATTHVHTHKHKHIHIHIFVIISVSVFISVLELSLDSRSKVESKKAGNFINSNVCVLFIYLASCIFIERWGGAHTVYKHLRKLPAYRFYLSFPP